MRFQKLLILFLTVGFGLSRAFSQTAASNSVSVPALAAEPNASQDGLLEVLRRKQAELDAKEKGLNKPQPAPQQVKSKPAVVVPAQPAIVSKPPADVSQSASQDQLTEILQKKQKELDAANKAKAGAVAESDIAKDRAASNDRIRQIESEIAAKEDAYKKSLAQPVPVRTAPPTGTPPTLQPGSKEDRLSELLILYKADAITPNAYHTARAKILAEP